MEKSALKVKIVTEVMYLCCKNSISEKMEIALWLPNKRFQYLFNKSMTLKNNPIFGCFVHNHSNSKNCYLFQHYYIEDLVAWWHLGSSCNINM